MVTIIGAGNLARSLLRIWRFRAQPVQFQRFWDKDAGKSSFPTMTSW
jgi:hypothetical protein